MNLKHLKNILNTYSDSELEKMGIWVNCCDEVSYFLIDNDNIDFITKNTEIKIGGYIEQFGEEEQ